MRPGSLCYSSHPLADLHLLFSFVFRRSALPVNAPRPSHSQVGTITQTCRVTLTPITGGDGVQSVREDKDCRYVVLPSGQSPPPPPSNSGGGNDSVIAAPSNGSTTGSVAPPGQTDTQTSAGGQTTSTDAAITTTSGASSIPVSTDLNPASSDASSTDTPSATSSSTLVAVRVLDPRTRPDPTYSCLFYRRAHSQILARQRQRQVQLIVRAQAQVRQLHQTVCQRRPYQSRSRLRCLMGRRRPLSQPPHLLYRLRAHKKKYLDGSLKCSRLD